MILKTVMDDLDSLNRCLHEQPEGSVGGPLHIVVDDGNLRDSDLDYCQGDSEGESDVVVRVLCLEIIKHLRQLTHPQRLVWWLRERIQGVGFDAVALAAEVRDGVVETNSTNGSYDARIWSGEQVLWEGLEQLEALYLGRSSLPEA